MAATTPPETQHPESESAAGPGASGPPTAAESRWILEWSLGAVALGGASLLVPLYAIALGGSPVILGVMAAVAALLGVPAAFLVGRLADRAVRRVVLIEAVLFVMLGVLLALPFVRHLGLIVLLNGVLWAAFAGAGPVLNLLAVAGADEGAWQERIARLNTFQGWGWAAGLVVGSVWLAMFEPRLGTLNAYRWFFGICACLIAVAALALAVDAPKQSTLRHLDPRRLRNVLLRAPRLNVRGATFPFTPGRVYDWTFRRLQPRALVDRFTVPLFVFYLAALLFFAGFAAFFAPLPIYLSALGFSSGAVFFLYLVSSVAAAVSFGVAGALAGRHDLGALQSVGLLVRGLAMPGVVVAGALGGTGRAGWLLIGILFVAIGAAWAIIAVTAATLVARLAPQGVRGEALGLYAAVGALAGALGSLVGGGLAEWGFGWAFGAAGTLVLVGAGLVYGLRGRAAPAPA